VKQSQGKLKAVHAENRLAATPPGGEHGAPMKTALALLCLVGTLPSQAANKNILLIAGRPSHPPGMHEFRAGCLLLQSCLTEVPAVSVTVYSNGWPQANAALEGANAVVIYADGGAGAPAL